MGHCFMAACSVGWVCIKVVIGNPMMKGVWCDGS